MQNTAIREARSFCHFHGGAGSRLERPADESILTNLRIRYISTDRPGHGLSDPKRNRKLLDWPDDIIQLVDHLGIDKFYVLGFSAGGPYALACAYKLADRVLAGAIVSSLAPPDRPNPYKGLPFQNRILLFVFRRMPKLIYSFRRGGHSTTQGVKRWRGSLAVAIDARAGIVAVRGWIDQSGVSALELAERVKMIGIERVIYTDVSRDGTFRGVNVEETETLARRSGLKVIASGGVTTADDVYELWRRRQAGIEGVILGRALYEKRLDFRYVKSQLTSWQGDAGKEDYSVP